MERSYCWGDEARPFRLEGDVLTGPDGVIAIRPTELKILKYFLLNQKQIFTAAHLQSKIAGTESSENPSGWRSHIVKLRSALGKDLLVTVSNHEGRQAGYRLAEDIRILQLESVARVQGRAAGIFQRLTGIPPDEDLISRPEALRRLKSILLR